MLDELKEYAQYTFDLDDMPHGLPADHRLRGPSLLENNFSGIPRAMQIIARRQLFPDGEHRQPSSDDFLRTENVLKHWCGFADDSDDALPSELAHLEEWAIRYISALCRERRGRWWQEESDRLSSQWRSKADRFDARLFDGWRNDHNRICYERIMAEALRQGPLRRRYLARDLLPGEDASRDLLFEPGRGEKLLKQSAATGRKLNGANDKYLLEMTVVALLQNGNPAPDDLREEWLFSKASIDRLRDWSCKDGKSALRKDVMCDWLYRDEELFGARRFGASGSLWCIRTNWFRDCNWRLVDSEDDAALREEYAEGRCVFFSEVGFEADVCGDELDKACPFYPFTRNRFYQ